MDFATPGYCSGKSYHQSELDMPGEFVESRIQYYRMRREVYAKGGCGEIHLGVDPVTKLSVAIKKGYSKKRNEIGVSATLIREIRFLKELMMYRNPNIVNLIDVFPHGGDLYLVEEFYPSYIQQYLVDGGTPFNEQQVKFIVYSSAKALSFLKRCKLIHGDVKPGNLLVSASNSIALTDFGSCHLCNDDEYYYSTSSCVSTLYFNAPEILLGLKKITYAADVWSLAMTWLRLMGVMIDNNPTEITMCMSILSFLGENPSIEKWSELSDIKEVSFIPTVSLENSLSLYEKLRRVISLELCSDDGLNVLCGMLCLNPIDRISIESICTDSYFDDCIYSKVMQGDYHEKQLLPNLCLIRRTAVLPPHINDFFVTHHQLQADTLTGDECSLCETDDIQGHAFRFENDNSICSPLKSHSFIHITEPSYSMNENSICL